MTLCIINNENRYLALSKCYTSIKIFYWRIIKILLSTYTYFYATILTHFYILNLHF